MSMDEVDRLRGHLKGAGSGVRVSIWVDVTGGHLTDRYQVATVHLPGTIEPLASALRDVADQVESLAPDPGVQRYSLDLGERSRRIWRGNLRQAVMNDMGAYTTALLECEDGALVPFGQVRAFDPLPPVAPGPVSQEADCG